MLRFWNRESREEKKQLSKIENSSSEVLRNEIERALEKHGKMKLPLLIQIGHFIEAANKAKHALHEREKEFRFDIVPTTYIDVPMTLRYISNLANVLSSDQVEVLVAILTKLAEKQKDTKHTARQLYLICSKAPTDSRDKLLRLSFGLLEKGIEPDSILSSVLELAPSIRIRFIDEILCLSTQMLQQDINPQTTISYICELPSHLLEEHASALISLSTKLATKGIDPKDIIWYISFIPEKQHSEVELVILSLTKLAEDLRPEEKPIISVTPATIQIDRHLAEKILRCAHANVNKGWMKTEQEWEMQRSLDSLIVRCSPEQFNKIAVVALNLLKHNRNPNDLFLLAKSIIHYSTERLDKNLDVIMDVMFKMKKFDAPLSTKFSHSVDFKESGFENLVFYKLSQAIKKDPEEFDEKLLKVLEKLDSNSNPETVFTKNSAH